MTHLFQQPKQTFCCLIVDSALGCLCLWFSFFCSDGAFCFCILDIPLTPKLIVAVELLFQILLTIIILLINNKVTRKKHFHQNHFRPC